MTLKFEFDNDRHCITMGAMRDENGGNLVRLPGIRHVVLATIRMRYALITSTPFSTSQLLTLTAHTTAGTTKIFSMSTPPPPFLARWRNLPDELKVQILTFTIPHNEKYTHRDFTAPEQHPRPRPAAEAYHNLVIPFLSVREIAGMVAEVFYGQNTISIEYVQRSELEVLLYRVCGHQSPLASCLHTTTMLPPPQTLGLVRHLEVNITTLTPQTLWFLQSLASNLTNLHHLSIPIGRGTSLAQREELRLRNHLDMISIIKFQTRVLEVEFVHEFQARADAMCFRRNYIILDALEMSILEKLSVAGEGKLVERLERYYGDWGNCVATREYVSVWPTVEYGTRKRITRKVVEMK